MDANEGVQALTQAKDRWNAGDLKGYLQLYRDDVVLHGYAGVQPGIINVTAFYQAFFAAFPKANLQFEDLFASGDRVACRFVIHGKHEGNFQGMPPTQKEFVLPGITILRFSGHQCVERWSQADFLSLLKQLGAPLEH